MFTVEVKINGNIIGFITGINKERIHKMGEYRYSYKIIDNDYNKKGFVNHYRKDGIWMLIQKILKQEFNNKD